MSCTREETHRCGNVRQGCNVGRTLNVSPQMLYLCESHQLTYVLGGPTMCQGALVYALSVLKQRLRLHGMCDSH